MSWRPPNELERFLLADTGNRWPELIPLARVLVLAPRIEPLLLRNARNHFLSGAGAELESQLWFSPLVASRSTREIVLHLGIASVLAGQLRGAHPSAGEVCFDDGVDHSPHEEPAGVRPPDLTQEWEFTCEHTRHWSAEDRLERDLRYHALRADDAAIGRGLQSILARIAAESGPNNDNSTRVALSRLAKRTLPTIRPSLGDRSAETARQLARYAALALGDGGDWSDAAGAPEALPAWLNDRLPPPLAEARLSAEIRWDEFHGQVLHLVEPRDEAAMIDLPSPLPGRLHVASGGLVGRWYPVTRGTRIPIDPPSPILRLTTLAGSQWDLVTDQLPKGVEVAMGANPDRVPLLLIHAEADADQANVIGGWLRAQGIPVELAAETPSARASEPTSTQVRSIRLWTRAAAELWARGVSERIGNQALGLVLRTERVDAPAVGTAAGRLIDWQDWRRLAESPYALELIQAIGHWWRKGEIVLGGLESPDPEDGDSKLSPTKTTGLGATSAADLEDIGSWDEVERLLVEVSEIRHLLSEITDPGTEPLRRLAIGDRLAELGDPRPGVGTMEIDVPIDQAAEADVPAAALGYPPDVQILLDEIVDPETIPPRRLEIGDELDRVGDPRPGVGLGPNGLPDIDWVEIPGGSFIYQQRETRHLPTFWIARYPITNAQYLAFIEDGGYDGSHWWKNLKRPEPRMPRWPQPNRPRTDVDWDECVAFGRWLTARLGLADGTIRLLTEPEWEKAARGEQGLTYPWGNEYRSGFANVKEILGKRKEKGRWSLNQTTAVGLYPQGRSPYGVEDLAGTVWEWCLNRYEDLEAVTPDTGGGPRALRGGSWIDPPDIARAVFRLRPLLYRRLDASGFRLVSSVPIEPVL